MAQDGEGAAAHQVVGIRSVERLRDGVDPGRHQGAAAGAPLLVEHVPRQDGRVVTVHAPVDCVAAPGWVREKVQARFKTIIGVADRGWLVQVIYFIRLEGGALTA